MNERAARVVYACPVRLSSPSTVSSWLGSRRVRALALVAGFAVAGAADAQPAQTKPPAPTPARPDHAAPKDEPAKTAPKPDPKDPKTRGGPPSDPSAKPATTASPSDEVKKIPRSVTAIRDIAAALGTALPPIEGRVLVGVSPLQADVAAPRAKALSVTIAQVFAGARGIEPPTETETLESVRGRAHGARAIVYLTPRIVNGELVVTADAFPVPRTVWARIRNPAPGPFAHAFAKAFIDAEVRSHLEPVPITAFEATRGRNFESGVIALACDDLDRDGEPEIVSVSRRSITLSRIRAGRLEPLRSHPWTELSSVDPAPLREAIGFAIPTRGAAEPLAPRDVVVSITDRALAIELDADFDLVRSFAGRAMPDRDAYACARLTALTVTGPLVACEASSPSPSRASVGGRYDALASAKLVTQTGQPFEVTAGREDGTLEVFDDAGHQVKIPHVGAQVAVADLDQDGTPEIITSLDVPNGLTDALVVFSWDRAHAKVKEVSRMPLAAGVHAIAACPPESAKRAPFLVATSDEIVVLR